MRTQTVNFLGYSFRCKGEITPDTQLWTGMSETGQRFFVVCTRRGLAQFKVSAYCPEDGGMLMQLDFDDLSEETRLKAAKVSDWPKVRRVGREWNFV